MSKLFIFPAVFFSLLLGACEKDKTDSYGDGPKTTVSESFQGMWMYGSFSTTEYWSQNPADYLGNAFELAIAFKFNANGTYEQYFTSRTVTSGISTYHQSLSRGTVEINEASKTIVTHAATAHYKQTKNNQTIQDRDLDKSEITATTTYTYELDTAPNGTKMIKLKLNGTGNALEFLKK